MLITTLTDSPSHESFGMTAFVCRNGDRNLVSGFAPESAFRGEHLTDDHLAGYVANGSFRDVTSAGAQIEALAAAGESPFVAGWYGRGFRTECHRYGVLPHGLPAALHAVPDGDFWIDQSDAVYEVLERWTRTAAGRAILGDSLALAQLARWALPLHAHTRAALWWTQRRDAKTRRAQVRSDLAMLHGSGAQKTVSELEDAYRDIVRGYGV